MMASAAPLRDIDEQFLQCAICLNQLREPKILPCLHRYCGECITGIALKKGEQIECPTCREKHTLPEGGTDSLKTDFNTKNIIEFIQLQDSVKHEPLKICANCSKKLKVASFCFRCNDFLCQSCDEHHRTSKIVRDHRPHIFSLSEVEARSLTIAKLSSLKEGPRCHHHQERAAELCCTTCGNLPICMPCTHGDHEGHNLKEVGLLAKIERERLTKKVADLMQFKDKVYQMQENTRKAAEELRKQVDEKKRKLREKTDAREQKVKGEIRVREEEMKQQMTGLGVKLEGKLLARKWKLDEEIRRATETYDKACEEDRREVDAELKKLQQEIEREMKQSQQKLDAAHKETEELLQSVKTQEEDNSRQIKVSDHFDDIVKRFEIAIATASSILDAKCDWSDVQCISDVCSAIDPLIEEVSGEFPALAMLPKKKVGRLPLAATGRGVRVAVTERAESVVEVKGMARDFIGGTTGNMDGCIVLTGLNRFRGGNHITVINWEGDMLRHDKYDTKSLFGSNRVCEFITRFHIATACDPNEIRVYDIRNGSYRKANLSLLAGHGISCVAADLANNHILVGSSGSKDVFVFSSDLKHIYTMTLPGEVKWPEDMTIHSSSHSLLVCDSKSKRAYAVTTEKRSVCKIKYEFRKPNVDGCDWWPQSVCVDMNGFVYILWGAITSSYQPKRICVQYSQEGGSLLTRRSLDNELASCLTTVETQQGEKLVIATSSSSYTTPKLITYGLRVNLKQVFRKPQVSPGRAILGRRT